MCGVLPVGAWERRTALVLSGLLIAALLVLATVAHGRAMPDSRVALLLLLGVPAIAGTRQYRQHPDIGFDRPATCPAAPCEASALPEMVHE